MHAFGRLLCLLAALCTVNAHLFLGQGVAWLTMIHDRAPQLGLQDAVADTFSGDHPCPRCLALAEEREKQQEETPAPESHPLAKFAPTTPHPSPTPKIGGAPQPSLAVDPGALASQRGDAPPSPPPRRA